MIGPPPKFHEPRDNLRTPSTGVRHSRTVADHVVSRLGRHAGIGEDVRVATYELNPAAVERARALIGSRQYVLDSDWGAVQPRAEAENAFLARHSFEEYATWHLGLTEGATDGTKGRYGFVYGDF